MMQRRCLVYLPADKDPSLTGAPRQMLDLVEALLQGGDDPLVVTQRESALTSELQRREVGWEVAPFPEVLDVHDEGVLEYGMGKKLKSAMAIVDYNRSMAALMRDHQVDIVIARGLKGVLLTGLAALRQGASLVWDIGVEKEPKRSIWLLHCGALLLSDRVVVEADSRAPQVFGSVAARLFQDKIETIYPGVEDGRRQRIESAVSSEDGSKPIDVISIGSIHPRKNQMMLVQAMEQVVRSIADVTVAIVGPVRHEMYFERVKEEVRDRGLEERISFLGWREDVPELLARSRILVTTSTREGVPYVVREAMYANLPVVGTDVGGMPEAVQDDVTGFLIPPGDADALSEGVVRLLENEDLRSEMGRAGSELASRRFSRKRFGARYRRLVDALR